MTSEINAEIVNSKRLKEEERRRKNVGKLNLNAFFEKAEKRKKKQMAGERVAALNGRVIENRLMKERKKDQEIVNHLIRKVEIPKKFKSKDKKLKRIDKTMKTGLKRLDDREEKVLTNVHERKVKLETKLDNAKTAKSEKKITGLIEKVDNIQAKAINEIQNKRGKVIRKYDLQKELVYL